MRNLKRALSLALASVMLLGMMVVGSSAAFADADEIVNTEAVEITAGLGLFAGSDGKFDPKGNVTRAQMATVIVKMLYGSEINADQFKGVDKFADVANFEGGWAEGYINLCANLKIVGGYGDGTFKPGNSVTTAEAVTMIINALKVDAGNGTWPLTVMSKAEEMKLFAELAVKPGTNVALTRDQLASIVLEGIKYSPADKTSYMVIGIPNISFSEMSDALTAAMAKYDGEDDPDPASMIREKIGDDSLWKTVFEVQESEGIITSNQAIDSEIDYTVIGSDEYAIETGLDMIGHYVTVYYKDVWESEDEPGLTYCIVDESKTITVDEVIDTTEAKKFRAAFGTKEYDVVNPICFDGTYAPAKWAGEYNFDAKTAKKGTYVIYDGDIISYIAPATVTASYVYAVNTTAGKETISIKGLGAIKNNADEDLINEYEGIAKDDYVTYTQTGDIYTVSKVNVIEGKVSKTGTVKVDGNSIPTITINGVDYRQFSEENNKSELNFKTDDNFNFKTSYKLYVTESGKFIGYKAVEGMADLSNIVYVVKVYEGNSTSNGYDGTVTKTYAQCIDMEGKEVNFLLGTHDDKAGKWLYDVEPALKSDATGFYTFEKHEDSKAAKDGIMKADPVKDYYNEQTSPIFFATYKDDDGKLESDLTYIGSGDTKAYVSDNTKFIVFNGDGTQLDVAVTTGSITYTFDKDDTDKYLHVLLSNDAGDNQIVEAVVIKDSHKELSVLTGDYIYVSAAQTQPLYKSGNGYVYEVYSSEGKPIEILVENSSSLSTGFFSYSVDEEENVTYTTIDKKLSEDVGAYYDAEFKGLYKGSVLSTSLDAIVDYEITDKTILVDARDEDEIEATEVYENGITSIEDVLSLKKDEDAKVSLDLFVDSKTEEITLIFVTTVTPAYTPDNGESLVYYETITYNNKSFARCERNDKVEVLVEAKVADDVKANDIVVYNTKDAKLTAKTYTVTIEYVDADGKVIKDADKVPVKAGKAYTAKVAEIEGYTTEAKNQEFTAVNENKTVTFTYTKLYTVTIKYVDVANGKEIQKAHEESVKAGKAYTAKVAEIKGYTTEDKDYEIEAVDRNMTVTFKYTAVVEAGSPA